MLEQYSFFTYIVFILDGLLVGFAAGLFAIGGGTAVVPVMTTVLGYSPKVAAGISAMQMVFSAFYNSYLNYKKGTLNVQQSTYPAIGGALGGFCAGLLTKITTDLIVSYLVLFLVFWAVAKLYISPSKPNKPERDSNLLLFFIGLIIGTVATSGGIGGAALLTPALMGICHFDIKKAASSGGLFVAFSGGAAFISFAFTKNIDYTAGAIIAISSLPGVTLGNWLFHKTTNQMQKKLMIGFLSFMLLLAIIGVLLQHGVIK